MLSAYISMIQTRPPQGAKIILITLCHFDKIHFYLRETPMRQLPI